MEQMKYRAEHYPLPDFTAPVMNGLAARFKWSGTPSYTDANHEPVIKGALAMNAKPGEKLKLKYTVTDPDKNVLAIKWWQYMSASTYRGKVAVDDSTSANTTFTVPTDAKPGDTIHLILEATDDGEPQMNRYHRLIITVIE